MTTAKDPATVDACLHLGHGFREDERASVVSLLDRLDHHLASEEAEHVRLDLHVKDPGQRGRKVTLECRIAGLPELVATSERDDMPAALAQVRDELVRQLDEEKSKRSPRH
jgi:ribosome-associated translation inhibitor RaiA